MKIKRSVDRVLLRCSLGSWGGRCLGVVAVWICDEWSRLWKMIRGSLGLVIGGSDSFRNLRRLLFEVALQGRSIRCEGTGGVGVIRQSI